MSRRYYANFAPQQTTAGSLTTGATSLTTAGSFTGWPSSFPFYATLELGTGNDEIVSVTNIVGTVATIVRAQDGSTAQSHPAGVTFDCTVVRQDFDEANVHINATTGVHGLAGAPVGTTDVQTLTNKTLTTPTLNTPTASGGTTSNGSHTGDATHPALIGQATTAGGKTLSLRNSAATEKLSVDDAGNVVAAGAVTGTALTGTTLTLSGASTAPSYAATGAVTGASFAASGNGAVAGVVIPKTYTTQAAATTAIGSPVAGSLVYLTAPTSGAVAGLFQFLGGSWVAVTPVATAQTRVGARAAFSGSFSVTGGAFTTVTGPWTSADDTGSFVSATTTSTPVTVPVGKGGAVFIVAVSATFDAVSTTDGFIGPSINGTSPSHSVRAVITSDSAAAVSHPLILNDGDTVGLAVKHSATCHVTLAEVAVYRISL